MGVAALTVLSAVAVFAVLGGIGLANGVIGVAQHQYGGGKVTICHEGHTITVSKKAWPAHQRHGDTPGTCAAAKRKDHGKHKGNGTHDDHHDHHDYRHHDDDHDRVGSREGSRQARWRRR